MLVILRDISRVRGKIFFFSQKIAYLSFRGMNERIYMKRRKKMEFLVKRSMRMWKIIRVRNRGEGGICQNSPSDISYFSRRLLPVPVPLVVDAICLSFLRVSKFRRRTSPVSREIAAPYEIWTRVRRQSITGECWNQPKCRVEGFPGWIGRREAAVPCDLLCEGRWMLSSTVVAVYQLKAPGPGPEFSNKRAVVLI